MVAPIMGLSSNTLLETFVRNSPNPAGAPGKLALTDENANNAPTGTTNISEQISGPVYTIFAAQIVRNTIAVSPWYKTVRNAVNCECIPLTIRDGNCKYKYLGRN